MRLLESILFFSSFLGWLYLIWSCSRFRPQIGKLVIGTLLGLLLLHALLEQLRWVMLPVYGIVILVLIGYSRRIRSNFTPRKNSRLKSILFSFLALLVCMLSWTIPNLLPPFQFTKPSGPYAIGVVDYTWSDPSRTGINGAVRKLNVRIWYPASDQYTAPAHYIPQADLFIKTIQRQYGLWAKLVRDYQRIEIPASYAPPFHPDAGPAPVIVYLHGNHLGTRFTGTFQALELASHGYIVIALEHPGTAFLSVFTEDDYAPFTNHFQNLPDNFNDHNAVAIPIIREQQADILFALEQLHNISKFNQGSPLSNQMDRSRIAVIGHSFGGAVAANMLATTTTIKAAINLDGYLYGEYPELLPDKPLLILNGSLKIEGLEETMTGLKEERALRDRLLGKYGLELNLPKAGHLSFTDLPLYSPLLAPLAPDIKEQHRLINEQTLRFLQEHL